MAIEIVDFPINSMVIFHSYVKFPDGMWNGFVWKWGIPTNSNFNGEHGDSPLEYEIFPIFRQTQIMFLDLFSVLFVESTGI